MNDRRRDSMADEEVPYSRLFIVGPKHLKEEELRHEFKEFGHILDIKVVRDRQTGENKGVYYVRYSKTSEAARALEEMKGKYLGGRTIKVLIASSRDQGSGRDDHDEDHVKRLFIMVSKTTDENELYDYFKQFGNLAYISILKNKETKESKGFAYVKYYKFYDAAIAFENCDRKYKPKFAEPKRPALDDYNNYYRNSFSMPPEPPYRMPPAQQHSNDIGTKLTPNFKEDGSYKLSVVASPGINQDQMWKLFDLIPSLDYCQIRYDMDNRHRGPNSTFEVVYTNSEWAMYAVEKFHGFEYPPGQRLIVKMENQQRSATGNNVPVKRSAASIGEQGTVGNSSKSDLLQLAETIAQATSLLKAAGLTPDLLQTKGDLKNNENYCSVPLPDPKPILNTETPTEARCFVICFPQVLPPSVLKDVFCRFGGLIDIYMLHNRNCGYAKYASKESAEAAIKKLHGAEILGVRLKVFEAEERPDKRQKLDKMEI
ncbi:unnamed protein product [Phyllotreta striolata]|uniref:RRM domain-containing protein n=1 Tax=Phyllotreta striolata TaxID=444603 RepID=A0A9N9XNX8_PHYSR|nr:unnamed protein product [Phyllotreta striolata]